MQAKTLGYLGAMALFALATTPIRLSAQEQPKRSGSGAYTVYNLGTLGGTSSSGNTINDLGWIIGNANLAGDQTTRAALWIDGTKSDLGTLGGANSVVEWPVHNDRGVISGFSETAAIDKLQEAWSCSAFFPLPVTHHVCLGFRYFQGTMTPLPTLGGTNGYAAGVNKRGDIVGWAENTVHDPSCNSPQVLQFEAVVWRPDGGVQELPPYPGDSAGAATAINEQGDVVGISGTCDNAVGAGTAAHALIWRHGVSTKIETFGGKGWNTPTDINNRGQAVGFADVANDAPGGVLTPYPLPLGFFWSEATGTVKILPLSGDSYAIAYAINDRGQVVGQSFGGPEGSRAFIWQNGKSYDLNAFLPQGSPLYLTYAEGINNRGEITGAACVLVDGACPTAGAVTPAFLAVPNFDWSDDDASAAALEEAAVAAGTPAIGVSSNVYQRPLRRFGFGRPASAQPMTSR
jgi:probable HAF family extracellular repeat protein